MEETVIDETDVRRKGTNNCIMQMREYMLYNFKMKEFTLMQLCEREKIIGLFNLLKLINPCKFFITSKISKFSICWFEGIILSLLKD